VLRVAQVDRNVALQDLRLRGLQQAALRGVPQLARIHRHEQVGRAVAPLGREALDQHGGITGGEPDLHAGFPGVGVEHRLDELLVAGGVDDEGLRGGSTCGQGRDGDRSTCKDSRQEGLAHGRTAGRN
jgi:hypothetical protein